MNVDVNPHGRLNEMAFNLDLGFGGSSPVFDVIQHAGSHVRSSKHMEIVSYRFSYRFTYSRTNQHPEICGTRSRWYRGFDLVCSTLLV